MDHINEDTLRRLLEQRLNPVEQAQVRRHLKTCYRCEQKLEQWRASFDSLSTEEPSKVRVTETRPGTERTILVPPDPEHPRSTLSRRIARAALMVALVLVAALAIDTLRQIRNPSAETEGGDTMPLATTTDAALRAGLDSKPSAAPESATPEPDSSETAAQDSVLPQGSTPPAQDSITPHDSIPPVEEAPIAQPADAGPAHPIPTSPAFRRITVGEAIDLAGRPLKLIGGLYPDHVEIAYAGRTPPGALPGTPVIRVVYRDPGGSVLHLDQQEIPEAYRSGLPADTLIDAEPGSTALAAWVSGTTRLTLSGNVEPDILRIYVRRVD